MVTFKQFLTEGGHATSKHATQRATPADVAQVLLFTSRALKIPRDTLKNDLIGSAKLTILGKKKDSSDVDIALAMKDHDPADTNNLMLKAVGGKGSYNPGTKVGSYAVPVGEDRRVQVDLMFVSDKSWAKWIYHSSEGDESQYPGAVRNIILMTALAYTQEHGKDFVHRDHEGKPVMRASKSIKMDLGMERLFKMAKFNKKTGRYNKGIEKVDPKEIEAHLHELGMHVEFSHDPEITNNPDHVASFVFGAGVKAKDLMTAEDVIKHVHEMANAREVVQACRSELKRLKLPVPTEL